MTDPPHFEMAGDPGSVRIGLSRAMHLPPLADIAPDDRSIAEIVLAEVLNNIAEHAYATCKGPIRLWLCHRQGRLTCRIEDEGVPMPGGRLPPSHCPRPDDLAEGGYGWHLIRSLALDLVYERLVGVNRLCFSLRAEQSRI